MRPLVRRSTRRGAVAALVAVAALLAASAGTARADSSQLSSFQDDTYLIDSSTQTVTQTLQVLQMLGVQQVRVNLEWANVAPDPSSRTAPAGFDAADPNAYPAANWAPYDRLAALAPAYGMSVDYDITSPAPLWATRPGAPNLKTAAHWEPSAAAFGQFVQAVGTRYDGAGGGPAVHTWAIWNEPNQPGWLAPQSSSVHGREVAQSPRMYRSLVDAAYAGLLASGHGADTILVGETAPEGLDSGGSLTALTPGPFLRDLYCVSGSLRPLRGASAKALGCPASGSPAAFVRANPGLFRATGFAHHPYDFLHAPTYRFTDPNEMPLDQISRLEALLDGTFHTYGVHRRLPLYFTEYGYETNPPNPYRGVSLADQEAWLNESDYLAWENPRVKEVGQFLLFDALPNPLFPTGSRDYWGTFQTGLLFSNGTPKPSLYAYRIPLWIPSPRVRAGTRTFVWGQVRPADGLAAQSVSIQWRPYPVARGSHPVGGTGYRTIATARTVARTGFLTARVRLPGSGYVKLAWTGPGGRELSRAAQVTVAGR